MFAALDAIFSELPEGEEEASIDIPITPELASALSLPPPVETIKDDAPPGLFDIERAEDWDKLIEQSKDWPENSSGTVQTETIFAGDDFWMRGSYASVVMVHDIKTKGQSQSVIWCSGRYEDEERMTVQEAMDSNRMNRLRFLAIIRSTIGRFPVWIDGVSAPAVLSFHEGRNVLDQGSTVFQLLVETEDEGEINKAKEWLTAKEIHFGKGTGHIKLIEKMAELRP